MSTVYHVECLSVSSETVTCRVTVNVGQVPSPLVPSRSFAFGFLWEGWHQAGRPADWSCGLFEWPAVGWSPPRTRSLFGGDDEDFVPPAPDGRSLAEGVRLARAAAWGQELAGYCHYTDQADGPQSEWSTRAARYVASVEIIEIDDTRNNFGSRDDDTEDDPVVFAVYAVRVTDARWLDWVRPGMVWCTVAYAPDEEWPGREQWNAKLYGRRRGGG